jgi:hypothetical protein
MGAGQRFFIRWVFFLLAIFVVFGPRTSIQASGKKVIIAEKKIAVTLPLGWYESDPKRDDVEAGFNTRDNRSSIFFRSFDGGNGTMQDLMDLTIANFDVDKRFYLKKVDDYKTGQVGGILDGAEKKWPAIFSQAEGVVRKEGLDYEMRFYLLVFDVGDRVYFVQASTTIPVMVGRENEIMEMIRSIVAKP